MPPSRCLRTLCTPFVPLGVGVFVVGAALAARPGIAAEAYSGAEIYAQSCAMCHAQGAGGAPRFGEAPDWRARIPQGRADLLRSVLRGKGAMPPKGGNASLTASEANAALDYMLAHSVK